MKDLLPMRVTVVLSLLSFQGPIPWSADPALRYIHIYVGFLPLQHMSSGSHRARAMYICSSVS